MSATPNQRPLAGVVVLLAAAAIASTLQGARSDQTTCSPEPVGLIGLVDHGERSVPDGQGSVILRITETPASADVLTDQAVQILVNDTASPGPRTTFMGVARDFDVTKFNTDQPLGITAVPLETSRTGLVPSCKPITRETVFRALEISVLATGD